jgi:hypothetical protein
MKLPGKGYTEQHLRNSSFHGKRDGKHMEAPARLGVDSVP